MRRILQNLACTTNTYRYMRRILQNLACSEHATTVSWHKSLIHITAREGGHTDFHSRLAIVPRAREVEHGLMSMTTHKHIHYYIGPSNKQTAFDKSY